ncbi:hypothetical protein LX32DRAFT_647529 [Colletotrichum zoysiae]|uniref:Uncharacterized protein n=1 Tax=Colletotrichum zoysiae TaxID=1216348 RepID=A0AAD9HVZ6_9PEZI|nr:hypothetical protein LX32DRAFT_647529 [Colletotrichum zoysiae]
MDTRVAGKVSTGEDEEESESESESEGECGYFLLIKTDSRQAMHQPMYLGRTEYEDCVVRPATSSAALAPGTEYLSANGRPHVVGQVLAPCPKYVFTITYSGNHSYLVCTNSSTNTPNPVRTVRAGTQGTSSVRRYFPTNHLLTDGYKVWQYEVWQRGEGGGSESTSDKRAMHGKWGPHDTDHEQTTGLSRFSSANG